MARRIHKDIEFAVDDASGKERIFKTWDEAAGFATSLAASGRTVNLDVLAYSRAGARAFMGDEGAEMYDEDPEASVFMRLQVTVNAQGRVP